MDERIAQEEEKKEHKRQKFLGVHQELLALNQQVPEAHKQAKEKQERMRVMPEDTRTNELQERQAKELQDKIRTEAEVRHTRNVLQERIDKAQAEGQAASSSAVRGTVDPRLDEAMGAIIPSSSGEDEKARVTYKIKQ